MPLEAGRKLGPYEIVEPIGKGGMGEVYRARDTKLDREVAIKVLSDEFAQDEERLARFEREAKLLASLNHPNIASIYGFEEADGVNALVLELVEGPTLAERIAQGPIPIDEAIAIAKQIAEALEAGHEAGIIHRDLKPANIKLKEDGAVKVLDYGLAKALEGDAPSENDSELSQSPTLTRQGTQVGVILGTAAYMSPEQARGKPVDRRADIWAFGAVVFEMLTRKRAFAGTDVSETLAHVLTKEPNWNAMPLDAPVTLVQALRASLTKDAKRRAHDIADVRLAIDGVFETSDAPRQDQVSPARWKRWAIAGVLATTTGVVAWNLAQQQSAGSRRTVTRSAILFNEGVRLARTTHPGFGIRGTDTSIAISSDGSTIFFVGERAGERQIFQRSIDRLELEAVRGTKGASLVFLSPNGEWLGFANETGLKKVRLNGEAPVAIFAGDADAASWGPNDTIFFVAYDDLWEVASVGGEPRRLTSQGLFAGPPAFLPARDTLLAGDGGNVVLLSPSTGEITPLTSGAAPYYLPSGYIVFRRGSSLWTLPFDADRLEPRGSAVEVLPGAIPDGFLPNFALSPSGTLIHSPAVGSPLVQQLVWVDREGNEEPLPLESGSYRIPRISADQTRIAYDACCLDVNPPTGDIWIYRLGAASPTRLTFDPIGQFHPMWGPDDERVVYYAYGRGMDWKASSGVGDATRLVEAVTAIPLGFSPDGQTLIYGDMQDIHRLTLGGEEAKEPLVATAVNELGAFVSHDGRWLAYASEETGRSEIYVRPYPDVDDGLWQVSRDGGSEVSWAYDGSELFYREGERMMSVKVEMASTFSYEPPRVLFEGLYDTHLQRAYDVARDGRFLMVRDATPPDAASEGTFIILVHNWLEELKRLAPNN